MITALTEDEKVDNFLDDGNALVLTMNLESRSDGDIRIHLNNLPTPGEQDDKVIMFFKKKPDIITPDNMHKVNKASGKEEKYKQMFLRIFSCQA